MSVFGELSTFVETFLLYLRALRLFVAPPGVWLSSLHIPSPRVERTLLLPQPLVRLSSPHLQLKPVGVQLAARNKTRQIQVEVLHREYPDRRLRKPTLLRRMPRYLNLTKASPSKPSSSVKSFPSESKVWVAQADSPSSPPSSSLAVARPLPPLLSSRSRTSRERLSTSPPDSTAPFTSPAVKTSTITQGTTAFVTCPTGIYMWLHFPSTVQ
ncbi:hypothetical protein B0H14DRAFT_1046353 [Mycena olivaceomarginata]|nr:hypothetical protein B0H14DRAFT_1046353 [Mycena olivaceomarginata]